jgi:hypothetical protein
MKDLMFDIISGVVALALLLMIGHNRGYREGYKDCEEFNKMINQVDGSDND